MFSESRLVKADFYSLYDKDTDVDSFKVRSQGQSFEIRLSGIDGPEIDHLTDKENKRGQIFGQHSTKILRNIIETSSSKNELYLRYTGEETYGRKVAEAFFKDKAGSLVSLNQELVRQQAAYLYKGKYADSKVATSELQDLYERYLIEGKGIYSKDAASPSEFRHKKTKLLGLIDVSPTVVGESNYNFLAGIGLVDKLPTISGLEKGSAISKQFGYENQQLSPFFNPDSSLQYILPSRHGISYFYEIALMNAAKINAGKEVVNPGEMSGYATAAYQLKYVEQHQGKLTDSIPDYIKRFDREMNTPGLGFYLNQWGVSQGYGRLYKDEEGALASLTGLVGSIVDRSLGYYGNLATPDSLQNKENISQQSNAHYKDPKEGFFQQTASFLTNFLITTGTGVVTYFTLGLPVSYLMEEANKTTIQGLLDNSLQQGEESLISKVRFFRELNTAAGLGLGHIGNSPQDLRNFLDLEIKKGGGEAVIHNSMYSLAGSENIFQRQRAGILFDNIIHPFISDVINPFNPTNVDGSMNQNWIKFRNALDTFGNELKKPISISIEEGSNKFVVQNIGFERQKSVAKALDNLAALLPANVAKWSFGKNFSQTADFISMGDVFSFSELTRTFENVWFNGGFHEVLSKSEVIDDTSLKGKIGSKLKSFQNITGQIVSLGIERLKGSNNLLGPILEEHKKLRNLESELIKKGALQWDPLTNSRKFTGSEDDLSSFVNGILDYQQKVNTDPVRETQLVSRASKYFEEQNFKINSIKNKSGRFISDPFLNNKGKIAPIIMSIIGLDMIASDFFSSTGGASLFSQLLVSLNHEKIAPVEFSPTTLFSSGNRLLDNTAWTLFALGAGYSIASVTQGVEINKYGLGSHLNDSLTKILSSQSRSIGQRVISGSHLTEYVSEIMQHRGVLRPKGNFFRNFVMSTTAILAAGRLGNWIAASGLNAIRNIPFIGEKILGKGDVKPNENLMTVTDLSNFRNTVLGRFRSGESLTNAQMSAAYQAGVISQLLPLYDSERYSPTVRTMAQQAPLPFIQFFLTSSTKGATFDEEGNVRTKGMATYNVGIQTAPIMGGNASLGIPIAVNFDGKNKFGISLHYNDQAQNVVNFLGGLTSLGSAALITSATALAVTETIKGASQLLGKKFGILEQLTEDLTQTSNLIKSSAKNINSVLEGFVGFPQAGLNIARGMFEANLNEWKQFAKPFLNTPGKINPWIKIAKAVGVGSFGLIVGNNTAAIFSDDPSTQFASGIVGAMGFFAYSYFYPQVNSALARASNTQIASGIKSVFQTFERNILNKISKRAVIPIVVSTAAAWLMTDSKFGVSVGMDDSVGEKLATVGLYAATVSTAVTMLSDFGKSAEKTASQYVNLINKRGNLNKVSNLLNEYKIYQTKKDLTSYTNLAKEFIQIEYTSASANSKITNVLNTVKSDDQLNTAIKVVRDNIRTDLSDFHLNQSYQDGLGRVFQNLDYQKYLKGRGVGSSRLYRVGVNTAIATGIMTIAVQGLGFLASGNRGGQDALNSFYSFVDNVPIVGEPIGNVFRLITQTDKKITADKSLVNYWYEDPTGKKIKRQGEKLIKANDPQVNRFNKIFGDLFAPFVLDAANAYQSIAPGVGVTFRNGEFGDFSRINFYAQLQSAGQDRSYAIYALTPATLMKEAIAGKGEYGLLIRSNLQRILGDRPISSSTTPKQLQLVSKAILSSSAELQPLSSKQKRKVTLPAMDSVMNLITSDSLLTYSFRERMRRSEELSYQPILSLNSQLSDLRNLSSSTAITNIFDISNLNNIGSLLKSFNPLASKTDQAMAPYQNNFGNLLSFLFGSKGNTSLNVFQFTQNKNLKTTKSQQLDLEDTGEWLAYSNAYIDMNSIEKSNPFQMFGQIFQGLDQLASTVTFGNNLAKAGIYLALGGISAVASLSFISSVFLKQESAALSRALEIPKEIMREGLKFRVGDALESSHNLIIQRGSVRYSINIPEDSPNDFGYKLKDSFSSINEEVGARTKTLVNEIFEVSENLDWKGSTRGAVLQSVEFQYNQSLSKYVDSIIDSVSDIEINSSTKFKDIIPGSIEDTRTALKIKLQNEIAEFLEKELAGFKDTDTLSSKLLNRYKFTSEKEAAKYLGHLLFDKTQWLYKEVKDRLLVLTPEDMASTYRLEKSLLDTVKERGGILYGSKDLGDAVRSRVAYQNTLEDLIEAGEIRDPGLLNSKGRLTLQAGSGKILKGFLAAGSTALSIFEPFDIYGSYARLGADQDNPNLSDDQRYYSAQGAGYTTVNSAIGISMGYGLTELAKKGANSKLISKLSRLRGGKLAAAVGIGIGVVAGVTAFSKSIAETVSKIYDSPFVKNFITEPIGAVYKGSINLVASTIIGASKVGSFLTGGLIKPGSITTGIGGALGVLSALFVASGFVSIGAGAFAIGGALGLIGGTGLSSIIPGFNQFTGSILGFASNWLSQLPVVGGLLGTKKDAQFDVVSNRLEYSDAIKVQTVTEAIQEADQIQLRAAADPSGERSRALFTNKTLYGQTYKENQVAEAIVGGTIKPKSLMNSFIDRELAITAQYFNQSVIGQTLWSKQIEVASDPNKLKNDRDKSIKVRAEASIALRQIEGQKQAELNNLKKGISNAKKVSTVKAEETNLLASIFDSVINTVSKPNEKLQKAFVITATSFNPVLKDQNLNAFIQTGSSLVLATQINTEESNNHLQINQNIAPENDLLLAVTRGILNPLNQTIIGFSF